MDEAAENAELVRRIVARDETSRDAEATLCTRFGPRAKLYGRKHLRDEDRARDLAQAVLLAVLEAARAGRIEDPAHLDRFVLGTCRNLAHRMRDIDARAQPTDVAQLDVRSFVPETTPMDQKGRLSPWGCSSSPTPDPAFRRSSPVSGLGIGDRRWASYAPENPGRCREAQCRGVRRSCDEPEAQ